jgi:hypothetical protein
MSPSQHGLPYPDNPPVQSVGLIVIGKGGVQRPGYVLRAGDLIRATHYDHSRRVIEVEVAEPLPRCSLRLRLRRWWEGWRR